MRKLPWFAPALAAGALVLSLAGAGRTENVCGDVNASGDVSTTDALNVLRKAVGQEVAGMFYGSGGRHGRRPAPNADGDELADRLILDPLGRDVARRRHWPRRDWGQDEADSGALS